MAAPDDPTPEQAVEGFFENAFDRAPGHFGIAVSGGGDSLGLLLACHAVAARSDLRFRVATVDHGLRPEGKQEAAWVAEICAARGIPHDTLTVDVIPGSDLQARARAARYDALYDWAASSGLSPVLMGHTRDDVSESMVMRLRRGVGLDGLAEMPRCWTDDRGQNWARPFLDLSREQLRQYLTDHDITPIEDPSNEDRAFERVEIRQALATLGWTDGALARSARHLARAAQSHDRRLADLFEDRIVLDSGDLLLRHDDALRLGTEEPDSLRRLALAALVFIGNRPAPREAEQANLLAFLRAPEGGGITLAGCRIVPEGDAFRFFRELDACAPPVPLGRTWDGRWQVQGPGGIDLTVGALGWDIDLVPWRDGPLPRASAMASPAVRAGKTLLAAPLAGLPNGYRAELQTTPAAAFRRRRPFFN